ncbi:carboxypeptidase regulatory-like domain-containing protein [Runella limosa]|uniref:carboxypeptidase regulatory-like domain-containing protein n=1 Tax=Runella limosa TaxID=370978 RepID=UPI000A008FBD|nr:carboxypeptidase-like regulatory domain-containing protein [Runella limosa]
MRIIFLLFLAFTPLLAAAFGIKGTVKTSKGEPLPYATIAIKGTSTGTIANAEGRYELTLAPGKYEVIFQYWVVLPFRTKTVTWR